MKNLIIISFILIVGLNYNSSGQDNKFNIGIEFGPSITTSWSGKRLNAHNEPIFAYMAGLTFQYNMADKVSLRICPSFEKKGCTRKISFTDSAYRFLELGSVIRYSRYYITVPVVIRSYFEGKSRFAKKGKSEGKTRFFIDGGVFLGYLVNKNQKYGGKLYDDYGHFTSHFIKTVNRFDFGLIAGLGVEIPIKEKILISIALKNNLGLYSENGVIAQDKTCAADLVIGLAYKLGRGKTIRRW